MSYAELMCCGLLTTGEYIVFFTGGILRGTGPSTGWPTLQWASLFHVHQIDTLSAFDLSL